MNRTLSRSYVLALTELADWLMRKKKFSYSEALDALAQRHQYVSWGDLIVRNSNKWKVR